MIRYKIDVMEALKEKGFTSYKLRKEGLLGDSTVTKLRRGEPISWKSLDQICTLLGCDVGDVLRCRADG